MIKSLLFGIITTMVFAGCGKDGGNSNTIEAKNEKYSYEFEFNGCKTGKHEFSELSAMCDTLQKVYDNHGCAESIRMEYFKTQCPGQTFVAKY